MSADASSGALGGGPGFGAGGREAAATPQHADGLGTKPAPRVARFMKMTGPQHGDPSSEAVSEVAGVCFNPREDRLYFSSQRAYAVGVTYEVTGLFRQSSTS